MTPADPAGRAFQLVLCAPRKERAALEIRLAHGKNVLDAKQLAWSAPAQAARPELLDFNSEAGESLASPGIFRAWTIGGVENRVATAIRPVLLGETKALLVLQQAGFEHLKQRHALYVADRDRLLAVWERDEGAGPHCSRAEVSKAGNLVYLDGFRSQDKVEPDRLEVRRFVWDADARQCRETNAHEECYATVFGWYPSVAEAQANRSRAILAGIRGGWILPAERLDQNRAGQFALAGVSLEKPRAVRTSGTATAAGQAKTVFKFEP